MTRRNATIIRSDTPTIAWQALPVLGKGRRRLRLSTWYRLLLAIGAFWAFVAIGVAQAIASL